MQYRDRLHKKMFWLLLYKDPNTKDDFDIDYDYYFSTLMREINGLNEVLLNPPGLIELMSILEAAYAETKTSEFNYSTYRKFVLDAHSLLDRMKWGEDSK